MWAFKVGYMVVRWLGILSAASDRWRLSAAPLVTILSWYRLCYDWTISKSMRGCPGTVSYLNLPYGYPTIKLKCFNTDGSQTCQKPGHSCVRNVCSFLRMPSRRLYRRIARSVNYLVDLLTPGWSLKDLSKAPEELLQQCHLLRGPLEGTNGSFCCGKCGTKMSHPGFVVADAGQAYETLSDSVVWSSIQNLFARANRVFKMKTISVMHSRNASVILGGLMHHRYVDRTVFLFSSLQRSLAGFLGFKFFTLGDVSLHQVCGVPIGGPLSPCVLHVVLSQAEHARDEKLWLRFRDFMAARYVDDVHMFSFRFCSTCLTQILHSTYHGVTKFDPDDKFGIFRSGVVHNYLDLSAC